MRPRTYWNFQGESYVPWANMGHFMLVSLCNTCEKKCCYFPVLYWNFEILHEIVTQESRDSSVGRASDWKSEGPRLDPGSRHTLMSRWPASGWLPVVGTFLDAAEHRIRLRGCCTGVERGQAWNDALCPFAPLVVPSTTWHRDRENSGSAASTEA